MFYKICLAVLIIGGLNWGLIGIFSFDLVAWICGGSASLFARIIYTLVGVSAVCCVPALFTPNNSTDEQSL